MLCDLLDRNVASLARTPIIQSAWRRGKPLRIHGWVYDLKDGLLRNLDCSTEVLPVSVPTVVTEINCEPGDVING